MGKRISRVAIEVLCLVMLTACQQTPEELVVKNKNDNKLEEKISATDMPDVQIDIPDKITDSVQSKDSYLQVNIDALFVLPKENSYPVVSIETMEITQEKADKIIDALIGDAVMYEKQYARTTDELTTEIQDAYKYIKEELAKYEETDPDYYKRKYESTIEWIKYLNELLETSTNEKKVHSGTFEGMNSDLQSNDADATRQYLERKGYSEDEIAEMMDNYNSQIDSQQFIYGVADLGKSKMASIEISKYSDKQQQVIFYNTESGNTTGTDFLLYEQTLSDEIGITYEQALEKAEKLLSEIGAEGMEVYSVGAAPNYDADGRQSGYVYKLVFTRMFDGVPVTSVRENAYKTFSSSSVFREPWSDERLEVAIDKTGIIEFKWENPVEIKEIINPNVEILSFEEIKNTFMQQILINNAYQEEGNTEHLEININRITLGLAKITQKNCDGYMYIPAWDFFGTVTETYSDEAGEYTDDRYGISFMTINAIDGTIIDRKLGY